MKSNRNQRKSLQKSVLLKSHKVTAFQQFTNNIDKRVALVVHPFLFILFSISFGYSQDLPKTLLPAYDKALHVDFKDPHLIETRELSGDELIFAQYINSLAGTLNHLVAGHEVPDLSRSLEVLENAPPSALTYFARSETYLFQSICQVNAGQTWKGFFSFTKSYKALNEGLSVAPNFYPLAFAAARFQVMLGAIPPSYTWVMNLLGYKGDIDMGVKQLEKLADQPHPMQLQTKFTFLLLNRYLIDEPDGEAWHALVEKHPNSRMIRFLANLVALKSHNSADIIERSFSAADLPIVQRQLAEAYLNQLNHDSAIRNYEQFLAQTSNPISTETYFKLWLAYKLAGDVNGADKVRALMEKDSKIQNEADAYAVRFFEDYKKLNVSLFKIRLLLDGGFFEIAREHLDNINTQVLNADESLEYLYRTARYHQLINERDKAIQLFKEVEKYAPLKGNYIGANTQYQLGRIYEDMGQCDQALKCYGKVTTYKDYSYESSLMQKVSIRQKGCAQR